MLFDRYEISRDVRMRFSYESSFFLLHNLLMRVYALGGVTRFAFEISWFCALMRFQEMSV
jgi:hypothetical protein